MGRDALPPRDPSKRVFEPSQERRSFVIDPVASDAVGSSGEPKIVEFTVALDDAPIGGPLPPLLRDGPDQWEASDGPSNFNVILKIDAVLIATGS